MIQYHTFKDGMWFRICGYGFLFADRSKYTPFSVRNGRKKELRFFKWGIQFIKPSQ